jgi:hypothetical protein
MEDSGELNQCLSNLLIIFSAKPSYPPNQGIQISCISTCIIVIYRGIFVSGMVLFTPEKIAKNNVKPSYLI